MLNCPMLIFARIFWDIFVAGVYKGNPISDLLRKLHTDHIDVFLHRGWPEYYFVLQYVENLWSNIKYVENLLSCLVTLIGLKLRRLILHLIASQHSKSFSAMHEIERHPVFDPCHCHSVDIHHFLTEHCSKTYFSLMVTSSVFKFSMHCNRLAMFCGWPRTMQFHANIRPRDA